jgi:hypothetical protein
MRIFLTIILLIGAFDINAEPASAEIWAKPVWIVANDPIEADGIVTSCRDIARFDEEYGNEVGLGVRSSGGILHDGSGKRRTTYEQGDGKEYFRLPYMSWDAAHVEFLKRTIDFCAESASFTSRFSSDKVMLSPSRAKEIIDDIYEIVEASRKNDLVRARLEEQRRVDEAAARIAQQERIGKLRSGEIKVQSMVDATLLHSPHDLAMIMNSPLLTPDGEYYAGDVVIDFQEKQQVIRAKIENFIDLQPPPKLVPVMYVLINVNKKTVIFNSPKLRIGKSINVIGRYVGNAEYKTVGGEIKVSPVIQAIYME